MPDDPTPYDFAFGAAPGGNWPGILGDAGEETLNPVTNLPPKPIIDHRATSTLASNTTNETTMLTATIPRGQPKPGDVYRLHVQGTQYNNTGGNVSYTHRLKFGSSTPFEGSHSIGSNAQVRNWYFEVWVLISTTAFSYWSGIWMATASGVAATIAPFGSSESLVARNGAAEDTSAQDCDVVYTIQMDTASANAQFTTIAWYLERVSNALEQR